MRDVEKAALEEVLRQMPAGVMIVEAATGKTIFSNLEAERISERYLGWTVPSELEDLRKRHDKVALTYHPDGRPYASEEWPLVRSIRDGEEVRDEEIVNIAADGTQVAVRCNSSPIYDQEGRLVAGVGVFWDITEQKRIEAGRSAAHRLIEDILESITDSFVALDREWRYAYTNERALDDIQGAKGQALTREDILGKNIWEEFPASVGSAFYNKYHEAMREQKAVHFEAYSALADRWVEQHVYPSEEGLAIYYRDITERKRAEEELEAQTQQQAVVVELGLRALAETNVQALMEVAVALVARTLDVEYSNIVELLPGGELFHLRAGVGWRSGVVGEATEEAGFGSQSGYTLFSNEPVIVENLGEETRFRPPPWLVEHAVVSSLTVVIPTAKRPFGVLGAHSTSHRTFSEVDVNFLQAVANVLAMAIERKRLEESLQEIREAERSRIARDLHDEVLQDLSSALVDAQRLKAISTDTQAARLSERLLATLDRVGPHLRGAIYDLRLESEQDRSFSVMLETMVELHRTMAPHLQIALDVQEGMLEGSLGQTGREILRIIGEALTNARRHPEATNVRVRVGISQGIFFAQIEDDGRGFDPSQEEPTPATIGGHGIRGMRERADHLGGELKIESEPGQGTKVRFELALQRKLERDGRELNIMLVEDHISIREALATTFEAEDLRVVGQAGSLAEARRMLEELQQPIDVAVVDLGLPDGYGADLIKELREKCPQAQALVLSASRDRAEIARAVEQGAAGVLNKSAHLAEVVDATRRLSKGETLMPLQEVVGLLRFAGNRREEEYEARQAVAKLTPREREVLQALAEGLNSEEIAERLHISWRTERNHMTNILSKLGVHSQLQALVLALRYGVVEIR